MSETPVETPEPEYPEHEKMAAVRDESQAIGEFLDWASSGEAEPYAAIEMLMNGTLDIEDVLFMYFKIDGKKIEAEKKVMIEKLNHLEGMD